MTDEPEETQSPAADSSHSMDLETVFNSLHYDAKMEAMAIHGILQSSGITPVLVGTSTLPVFEFQVQVPPSDLEEARRILAEGEAAGPPLRWKRKGARVSRAAI
jgi:Putative prokaryotic signal transducing protein